MRPRNLPNWSVFPSQIGHGEVDRHTAGRPVHDQALAAETQCRKRPPRLDVQALAAGEGQTPVAVIAALHVNAVGMQVLIFDGTGQAKIAARTPHQIVVGAKDLRQDGRHRRQIDHLRPGRVVQHLARRRGSTVTVAVRQATALRHVFASSIAWLGRFHAPTWLGCEHFGKHLGAALANTGELLNIKEVPHHHEAVAPVDTRRPGHLLRRTDLQAAKPVIRA